jgi:hypothetical protein
LGAGFILIVVVGIIWSGRFYGLGQQTKTPVRIEPAAPTLDIPGLQDQQASSVVETEVPGSGTSLKRKGMIAMSSIAALRATSASTAIDAAMELPIGHPDRREVLLRVGAICRRLEVSDPDSFLKFGVENRLASGSDAESALIRRWFAAMRTYCGGVSGTALIDQAATERGFAASTKASELANQYAFVSALAQETDLSNAFREPGVEERLWDLLATSESYGVMFLASHQLAAAGTGPFAETERLIGRAGRLTPESDALRTAEVRDAAAKLFVCRTLGACGPGTALGLQTYWISELHATAGIEGMLRSQHSPVEWEVIEEIYRNLQARRENH